ncbi:SgcJ/EcaC family oxidoreductase [Streptomyces triticirhizae]|uniref:SgcJ/EcaC family oxidoreductase n=1 Tax=Streptomyces triticirhizae TaxID=2483353 RepID=A0A3M2M484_9ACTN|nr:SgcJ/EcaC family oxidoreductase [Streptomyces triticirhizae]RMI43255.1 SgcJ/EcaC family oxidoreductase [Streptomyces triticirhizae]RMI44782.1 SgcJ/EcaC family oxidoreductase [Streptomyces triticirhizae]
MNATPAAVPTPEDEAAIRQLVADASAHQSDVERFLALHTADATVVNFGGRRVAGRDALEAAMRAALASPLADVTTTVEIEAVRLIRPDVAIVASIKNVYDGRGPGAEGEEAAPLPASSGRLTYVLVREDNGGRAGGGWRITSAQTTPIPS